MERVFEGQEVTRKGERPEEIVVSETTLAAALFDGKVPSAEQQRVAREAAGLKANLEFLTRELFPTAQGVVLTKLRLAKTAEALWQVKGNQELLDTMVQLTESRIKALDPTVPVQRGRR